MSVGGGGSWCQISDPTNFLTVSDKGLRPGSEVSYRIIIGDNLWVLGSFEGSSGDPRGPLGSRGMFRGPKGVDGGLGS